VAEDGESTPGDGAKGYQRRQLAGKMREME